MLKRLLPTGALLLMVLAGVWLRPEASTRPVGAWMAGAGVEPRFETVAGLKLRYVRRGAGPPVLLLHGLGSSLYTWKDVLPALAERRDVLALDLPGFGGSDIPAVFDGALYPRVVLGLLDKLGLSRVSIVGNSLGGAVAVATAARRPERVAHLVVVDAAGFNLASGDRPWILRLAGRAPVARMMEALPLGRPLVSLGLRQVFYDANLITAERTAEYWAPLSRRGSATFIHRVLAGGQAMGLPDIVREVRAPTLVIWGEDDAWVPVAHAERFARAIPGARSVILPDCGHLPQEERPAEVVRLLEEFLP